jgi:hypothetical protein
VVLNDSGTMIRRDRLGRLGREPDGWVHRNVPVNVLGGGLWTISGLDAFGLGNATTNDTLNITDTAVTTAPTTFQFGNATGGSNAINVNPGGLSQVQSTWTITGVW